MQRDLRFFGKLGFGLLLGFVSSGTTVIAQPLPACEPPRSNEYLLLVPNRQADTQTQLQQLLPNNAVLTVCDYLNTAIVRVEGFASSEVATAWAEYIADMAQLQAYVASPANLSSSIAATPVPNAMGGTSSPVANSAPSPTPSAAARTERYQPQPLGGGYAVLVSYFDRPELAVAVRQVTSQDVGLVAVDQQPFLLATHTTDAATASRLLQRLSEQGLTATMIDSRRAVLLTSAVQLHR